MAKKQQESFINGQLSIWDIKITEEPTSVTKTEEKITKNEVLVTKRTNSFTENQEKVIEKYKVYQELNRIIHYCGGGVGIELIHEGSFKTIYVNAEGKEEFILPKKTPVLPMDRILYYKSGLIQANDTQEQKLEELKKKSPVLKVIRRKGDENILVVVEEKVISINALGWILEFENVQVAYTDDEIENIAAETLENLLEIQRRVKVGDFVEASFGDKVITGKICRVYGPDNVTLNIIFDNGKKHTAIYRGCVKRLIQSA